MQPKARWTRSGGKLYLLPLFVLIVTARALADTSPLGSAQLTVQGSRLTIYHDGQANDADQTVNVGEPARVRTCFGSAPVACGATTPGDPRVQGLSVLAELSGPELPSPVPFQTLPGGTFFLPGFQKEGDYRLENIRLVETATSRVVGAAQPPSATLRVRQILLASATVTRLSLAELEARGIALTRQDFRALKAVKHQLVRGSDLFARRVGREVEGRQTSREVPTRQRSLGRPGLDEIVAAVGKAFGEKTEAIRRPRGGMAREAVAYLARREGAWSIADIGGVLGVRSWSASHLATFGEKRVAEERGFREEVEAAARRLRTETT